MYPLLKGLRIIEVSSFVASPTVGLYCAQMGAEVIRVDHVRGGLDYGRYLLTEEGRSLAWENLNRGKKSLALDLRSDEGREALVRLAGATGILVTNLAPDSFLDHATLAKHRADMITLRIMGWHDGRQAMDFTVNAASGYPLMTGPEEWDDENPSPVNQVLPAWDFICGAYGAFALLAALRHRDTTGEGGEVRIPLGDVMLGTVANSGAMAEMLYRDADRERLGNNIWGAFGRDFTSRDGVRFMLAALTDKQWAALIDAFGVRDEIDAVEQREDVSFDHGDHNRFVHRTALAAIFAEAAEKHDYAAIEARLTQAGATFERYRTMHELVGDERLVSDNPLFGPSPDNPSGFDYPAARSIASIPGIAAGDPLPAPRLGADGSAVLKEVLGLSDTDIDTMRERGIVATPEGEKNA